MSATSTTNCLGDVGATADLVPSSDTKLAISCDDSGVCVNRVDASVDTPAGKKACVVVSGEGHAVAADSAVAVQTKASEDELRKCSPFFEGETLRHNFQVGFTEDAAKAAWREVSGTYSEFSFDTEVGDSTAICQGVASSEAGAGVPQFCGGQCDMVFLGRKAVSTNMEKRIYASACRNSGDGLYSIYRLAFTDFEVRYTAVINGTVWNLWEEQPAGMTLSLDSLELANPFEGYEMALQGSDYSTAYASLSAMSVTNCNGYCGFASRTDIVSLLTMYGRCVTPSDGCGSTSSSSTCTATVQSFDQRRAGAKLPAIVSGAILQYNNTNVIVSVLASAIPLRGRVEFSVPNAERVLPSEAATNVNGIMTAVVPQDADHEDVVVVYTDGAVATASRDCAFTLLETRDKNRMYSMRNVRRVKQCDLLVSNGTSERSLSVAAQTTKNSDATVVENATALWPAHPPGSESRSSGLSKGAKIGIGVGVPGGVIVIACTIVLFVYLCYCRKRREARGEEDAAEAANMEELENRGERENPLNPSPAKSEAAPGAATTTNDAGKVRSSGIEEDSLCGLVPAYPGSRKVMTFDEDVDLVYDPRLPYRSEFGNRTKFSAPYSVLLSRDELRPIRKTLPYDNCVYLYIHVACEVPDLYVTTVCRHDTTFDTLVEDVRKSLQTFISSAPDLSTEQLMEIHRMVDLCYDPNSLTFCHEEEIVEAPDPWTFVIVMKRHNLWLSMRQMIW